MEEEPNVRRSRFDQREPKKSRFDRRSRSPPMRRSETRDRSPLGKEANGEDTADKPPVAAAIARAAAAGARVNASLEARKGIQHVDVPPIQNAALPQPKAPAPTNNSSSEPTPALSGEMYIADGDYIQDIEVNDLRNRYVVTKSSTQKMINEETGADITTRGNYYPVKSLATAAKPPLHLHVTSQSKEGLEKAVAKIHELIKQDLPQLVDDRRLRRRDQDQVQRDEYGRRKWRVEKVPIDIEPVYGFYIRAQIVGEGGRNVKWIQDETGCRVQIKGKGSGFMEPGINAESDEDMYLSVTGPDDLMIDKAVQLCKDLVGSVKEESERFASRPPRHHGGQGGHGGQRRGGHYGGYDHYSGSGPQSSHGYASQSPAPGAGRSDASADHASAYAQYYGNGQDPYAAWGGYHNYVALYQQYYAQAQQQQPAQPAQPAAPGNPASPPPPPPSTAAPPPPSGSPPPPPPSGPPPGTGAYSNLPPPPGL